MHRRDERLKVESRSTVAVDRELLPDVEAILALSSSAVMGSRYLRSPEVCICMRLDALLVCARSLSRRHHHCSACFSGLLWRETAGRDSSHAAAQWQSAGA